MSFLAAILLALFPHLLYLQASPVSINPSGMEITLERLEGQAWKTVNPALIFASGDRVRFRFKANFDGFLYVTNRSTSGNFDLLFPRKESGTDNQIKAGREYLIPAAEPKAVFRIAGPPGQEITYWMVSPIELPSSLKEPNLPPASSSKTSSSDLIPRCDGGTLQARGECVDSSAGPQRVPTSEILPRGLNEAGRPADLLFMRKQGKTVVSSAKPLSGPVIYQFRLAHK
jgi:Domain of unknown function (DUF4384)